MVNDGYKGDFGTLAICLEASLLMLADHGAIARHEAGGLELDAFLRRDDVNNKH